MSPFKNQKILINLFILSFLILMINSQLTIQDKENIENFVKNGQSKNTGLFFESSDPYKHTKQAISVLKILNIEIKHQKEICKRISEIKEIDVNIVTIDKLLGCKINFKDFKVNFNKNKLIELYNQAKIGEIINIDKLEWKDLYRRLKIFLENGKFGYSRNVDSKRKSILATALGIEMLSIIGNKIQDLKSEILPMLKKSVDALMKDYSELNDDMIVFLEKNVGIYKLNYHIITATKSAKKLGVEIPLFNTKLYKLLNYFNTFKYEMISKIDNTYYLMNIFQLLEKTPLMQIKKDSFNYLNEKKIKINFENIYGEKLDIKNTTLNLEIIDYTDKNP